VLPGRGEHGGVYERFGRRLAADAYVVHALDVAADDDLDFVARQITGLIRGAVTPVALAGSDTGAAQALVLAAGGAVPVDGLLLAGLPTLELPSLAADSSGGGLGAEESDAADWDDELAARTTCPAHRARLADDDVFTRGSLGDPVPAGLDPLSPDLELEDLRVPVLLLHGGADPVAALDPVRIVAARLPRAELAVTEDGRHDVLNDATHRTVAAQVVQWLERLRGGPDLTPIIAVEARHSLVAG
jgi:pimeloyl-ACP methyl ester carboxylesterase